ncbi:MAG TPA: sugar phosphate nucleotidyltransferase [Bacteroidota bacterium]
MNPNLVILAGGVSSRMKEVAPVPEGMDAGLLIEAGEKSKSMLGVGRLGRPFLDYLISNAREAGYADLVIVVGENDGGIRARYGSAMRDNEFHGVRISYAVQPVPGGRTKPLGTADALLCALRVRTDWRGKKFTVCNSDNLYSQSVLKQLLETGHPGALIDYDRDALRFEQSKIEQFAVLEKDSDGYLTGIIEKPSLEDIRRVRDAWGRVGVSMNIFRFSYDTVLGFLEEVPLHPVRQEKELPAAVALMVRRNPRSVLAIPVSEYVPDLTGRGDIGGVQEYLRDHCAVDPF